MELKITPLVQTIVKPTALGPVANTDTKLLIDGLFQKGRVLAHDAVLSLFCPTSILRSRAGEPPSSFQLEWDSLDNYWHDLLSCLLTGIPTRALCEYEKERMKGTLQRTAFLLAVTCGLLAWLLAGANPSWAQDEAALDICLNSEREPVVRVEACRTAAEQGNARAQYNLGLMHDNGKGVPQDDGEAVKWYRLAAEQGYAPAQLNLGVMYSKGEGVPQDYAEAVKWHRLAAEQGDAPAQLNLGLMYRNGKGVPQDYAEAVKWYRLAAEQEDATAQLNLGVMYSNGEGVPQDDCEAVKWYRLAAEQGYASAQFNLGLMYYNGEGVPQDYAEAVKWYRLAAEQGDALAQLSLGLMYSNGEGVRKTISKPICGSTLQGLEEMKMREQHAIS